MTDTIRVLYNDTCPVCRFEIDAYRRQAEGGAIAMGFDPVQCAADWGLHPEQAAQRLHVMQNGQLLSGMAAFRAIWARLPRWRWAASVTGWPLVRPVLDVVYDRIAAPALYRAHLRRQRKERQEKQGKTR